MNRHCFAIAALVLFAGVVHAAPAVQATPPDVAGTELFLSADGGASCAANASPADPLVFTPQPLPRFDTLCGSCSVPGCVGGTLGRTTCHAGTVPGHCDANNKCSQSTHWSCFCNTGQ